MSNSLQDVDLCVVHPLPDIPAASQTPLLFSTYPANSQEDAVTNNPALIASPHLYATSNLDVPSHLDETSNLDVPSLLDETSNLDVPSHLDVTSRLDASSNAGVPSHLDVTSRLDASSNVGVTSHADVTSHLDVTTHLDTSSKLDITAQSDAKSLLCATSKIAIVIENNKSEFHDSQITAINEYNESVKANQKTISDSSKTETVKCSENDQVSGRSDDDDQIYIQDISQPYAPLIGFESGINSGLSINSCDNSWSEYRANMGNKQTAVKTAQEDEDTPDEAKTKCCQVPKKKLKDKNKRISRASRSDDLGFDSDEVYPFDRRTRSESELNEPVELDPFDIVDTDDIRFVPGAGTSDVIKSASEPKFTTIPEETVYEEENGERIVEGAENTDAKTFFFPPGNKIAEPGTSTAHSTFEFKHVKSKNKAVIPKSEPTTEPLYENVHESPKGDVAATPSDTPLSSPGASKPVSRQNSKEPIQKPLRKSKKGKQTNDQETEVKTIIEEPEETNVKAIEAAKDSRSKPKRPDQPAIRDSEIDRNIDSVLMLTQTMFSKIKKPEAQITLPAGQKPEDNAEGVDGKYENVNVCVKLEPTGLQIAHKETKNANDEVRRKSSSSVKSASGSDKIPSVSTPGKYENVNRCAKFDRSGISIGHKDGEQPSSIVTIVPEKGDKDKGKDKKKSKSSGKSSKDDKKRRKASDDKEFVQISRTNSTVEANPPGILHISDSGTLIIKADKTDNLESKETEPKLAETSPEQQTSTVVASDQQAPQRGMLHISDSGTLIIQSLPKPPSHAPSTEKGGSHYYENDIIARDKTDIKTALPENNMTTPSTSDERKPTLPPRRDQSGSGKKEETRDSESSVPPSSPSAMDMLAEVLEEEEEDDVDDEAFEDELNKRQSAEMFEFTENVCKRLSQLLELENKDDEENEDYLFESGTYGNYENIYETLNNEAETSIIKAHQPSTQTASYDSGPVSKQNLASIGASSRITQIDSVDSDVFESPSNLKSISSEDDDMPEYFDPRKSDTSTLEPISSGNFSSNFLSTSDSFRSDSTKPSENADSSPYEYIDAYGIPSKQLTLPIRPVGPNSSEKRRQSEEVPDKTPTMETTAAMLPCHMATAVAQEHTAGQEAACGRRSVTCTESDLDISEHRDDLSTDSMLADDEEEETMEILFTKTYTEPVEGAEVFLSCTVVNSAYKDEKKKKSDTWLSDEALEYFEANASEVMSTAFIKAKREMKDIQACLQNLRKQMEHFHGSSRDDISLPDIPVETLSPDYFGFSRKAITD